MTPWRSWAAPRGASSAPAGASSAPASPSAATKPPVSPPAASQLPQTRDLSSLLAGMRSSRGVVAEFQETRELALLSSPLEATGAIYFIPPSRLVRVVTSPGHSRLVVDGDKVRFEDETGHKDLDLSSSPIARQMIDSFVVLFDGDETRLHQLYDAQFHTDGQAWSLHLTPRSMPLDRMIKFFEMSGTGPTIDRMEAVEPDGDRTVTRFGRTETQHEFSKTELAELFGDAHAP
ncbi:MAG TPA: outer membrane lipoprotein carrier protein LolA [Candidatus Binatia bacterium]